MPLDAQLLEDENVKEPFAGPAKLAPIAVTTEETASNPTLAKKIIAILDPCLGGA